MKINPEISQWFTRTAAGVFFEAIGFVIGALYFPDPGILITTVLFMLFGIFYAYKLFDRPQVSYHAIGNVYYYQLISMLWFGLLSWYVVPPIQMNTIAVSLFPMLLPSILGFSLGYRVLLLPSTLKGFIKVLMIGLIGYFITAIPLALLIAPQLSFGDAQGYGISSGMFVMANVALLVGLFRFCPRVLLGVILFYFIGLFWRWISGMYLRLRATR